MTATHPLVDELAGVNAALGNGRRVVRKIVHRDEGRQITAVDEVTLEPADTIGAGLAVIGERQA